MISAYIKRLPLSVRHTFHYDPRAAMLFGVFGGFFFPFMLIVGRKIGATDSEIALISAAPYNQRLRAPVGRGYIRQRQGLVCGMPNALGRPFSGMFFIAPRSLTRF